MAKAVTAHPRGNPAPRPAVRRPGNTEPMLADYGQFLRRHRMLLVAMLGVGLLGGVLTVVAEGDTYTAHVSVLTPAVPMNAAPDPSGRPPEDVTMDTEAQLLRSGEVLRRLTNLGPETGDPRTIRDRISLTVPPNTRVLVIHFQAPTADGAKAGADVVADTFLRYRHQLLVSRRERDLESLRSRIASLQGQLDSLSAGGDKGDTALREDTTSARRQTLVGQIEDLQEQLASVDEPAADTGTVVRASERPLRPDDANDEVTFASAVGMGLLAGLGLGLVRDRLPRRVRDEGDVVRRTGMRVLAEVAVGAKPRSLTARRTRVAYRRLHNVLAQERAASVLLTADTTRLAAQVAAGLATTSAQTGRATTILLAVPEDAAAAEVEGIVPAAVRVEIVLTEHLQDARQVARILQGGNGNAQLVVAGPTLSNPDALSLAAGTDAVVLVAERGRTRDRELTRGQRSLELAGGTVRGVVLVRAPHRRPLASTRASV